MDVTIITAVGIEVVSAGDFMINVAKFYRDDQILLTESNKNLLIVNSELKKKISTLEDENTLLKDSSKGSTDLNEESNGSTDLDINSDESND